MRLGLLIAGFALVLGVAIPVAEARQGHDGNCGRDGDIGSRLRSAVPSYASLGTYSADTRAVAVSSRTVSGSQAASAADTASAAPAIFFASSGYITAGIAAG